MDVRLRGPRRSRSQRLAIGAGGALAAVVALAGPLAATSLATSTATFVTAGSYTFRVPDNVNRITVNAVGAAGGSCTLELAFPGGEGGSVGATFPVKPGARLHVGVGGVGGSCVYYENDTASGAGGAGGVGGGGGGGTGDVISGAGGGGASGVGLTSLAAGTSPLVVAGGGGGAAYCTPGGNAGADGGTGQTDFCEEETSTSTAGGGASDSAGGTGGTSADPSASPGANGTAGTGGAGGNGDTTVAEEGFGGGGGGGGYYGGGGGAGGGYNGDVFGDPTGGGGGSSFVAADATHVSAPSLTASVASVTISYSALPKPKATTKKASGVKSSSATLHGSVNPEGLKTTYYFQYGTTSSYGKRTGNKSLKAGTSAKKVAALIHGLTPGTTYHFRVVATNASGTADGVDRTFTTPGAVLPAFTG